MCKAWSTSFAQFYKDMGPRPSSKHSIDRINNEGNYEPGNCRWATASVQSSNQRVRSTNTSGVTGVHFCRRDDEWNATLKRGGTTILNRYFKNKSDAIAARKDAEVKYENT